MTFLSVKLEWAYGACVAAAPFATGLLSPSA